MPNIKKNISRHNSKLLQNEIRQQNPALFKPDHCNCQDKATCPMPGKCNANNVVYRGTLTWQNNNLGETYTGVTKILRKDMVHIRGLLPMKETKAILP